MITKLTDAGLDYLRVTTQDRGCKANFARYYARVALQDAKLGYKQKTGGAFGFIGQKTRHALIGDKGDWQMLQVSGYSAKSGWFLAHDGSQASRIDLQLTVFVGELCVEQVIRDAYNAACKHIRSKSRPIEVTMIEKRGKAQTVYLGKRSSDIFCRIYDKFEESGKEEHRGCVRYEVELKGRASKACWQSLVLHKTNFAEMLQSVIACFAERGVLIPVEDVSEHDIQFPKPEPTTTDNTLAWLQRQVAPTVKRLTEEFGYITPFRILFETALTDFRAHRIMRMLSVVWGS
jgi:DNA relaxase NicK